MPIFVGDHHFLDNLLEILVSCFDCPIHLWSIRGRVEVLNLPFGAQFVNQLPIKVLGVIGYQSCRQTVTTYQILFNKSLDYFLCYMGIRVGFYPLGEVVDGHQNESMPIARFGVDWPYNIQTPHIKRPRRDHIEQRCRRRIYLVAIYLTLIAFSHIVYIISLHGQPEVSSPCFAIVCPLACVAQIPSWTSFNACSISFPFKHLSRVSSDDLLYKISPSK